MKRFLIGIYAGCTLLSLLASPAPANEAVVAIRVVDCDAPVQSHKRGICENKLSAEDFTALAPGVSWYYNWHFETKEVPPADAKMDFVPMVWGDTDERLRGFEKYLVAGHKPRAVLAINEPNLKGQAFITPEKSAALYLKIKAIADPYKIPVVGPNMALGSPANQSISAADPIEKKNVTYTFMVPYLKAFNHYIGDDSKIGALGIHGYGNFGELDWMSGLLSKEFGKPVWVTEYAWWKAPSDAEELKYLVQSTDLLERLPMVHAYAWFKDRVEGNKRISLLEKEPGKLTAIGKAYVTLPVHDADIYYRLPGKLSAGRYVRQSRMQMNPTDDAGGFIDMTAQKESAWCDYNVQVQTPGLWKVSIRTKGKEGDISISKDGQSLATEKIPAGNWQTISTKVQLGKGSQSLHIACTQAGQVIEWIEFSEP